jgi:MFS family permease
MADTGKVDAAAGQSSAWAPFRSRLFATMWLAQFISNTGGWMQTVGGQWLMLTLTGSAAYVAFVQTAGSLPVLVFAVLAGTLGDLLDRRRLLLATQSAMLVVALGLALLTIAGRIAPWSLLVLLFAIGAGQALTAPTWQTLQPELVPAEDRTQAISLGSVNQNLARAVGPAIGGVILAWAGAGTVFLLNAVSFSPVIVVVAAWRSVRPPDALPREHISGAVRAGARYVAASPVLRVILLRAALFSLFAAAIWALLPLTANEDLHLGAGGYGLLLGGVGVGAVAGAALLPRLRGRLTPGAMLAGGSVGLALVALLMAYVHVTGILLLGLIAGGICWIISLSTLNSLYQMALPRWVKTRGMSYYIVAFQGGSAFGSAVMGLAAQHFGLSWTLLGAAAGLGLGSLGGLVWKFQAIRPEDLLPAGDWPQPQVAPDEPLDGPVLVTVEYWAQEGREDELLVSLRQTRFSRRRTGATSWRTWHDVGAPRRILEQFVVASWSEHLRQHERVTRHDQQRLDRIRGMTDPGKPVTVTHWSTPRVSVKSEAPDAHATGD